MLATRSAAACEAARHNESQPYHELLSDALFARLCEATPVSGARGSCFELDGATLCLPTFLVVGFTKSGTTAFFRYLSQHPLVHLSPIKEPGFFGADAEAADRAAMRAQQAACAKRPKCAARAARMAAQRQRQATGGGGSGSGGGAKNGTGAAPSVKTLRWYAELFGSCARCGRGEATPSYAWRDHSAAAAAQVGLLLGGGVSLVMLVREPLARAASHYAYFRRKRYHAANLSSALRDALDELQLCASQLGGWRHECTYRDGRRAAEAQAAAAAARRPRLWRHRHGDRSYELLQAGLYSEHIATWRREVRGARLLVLPSAALWRAPAATLRRFERFAGLPRAKYARSDTPALRRGRRAGGSGPRRERVSEIEPGLRGELGRFLAPFNRRLEEQTGIAFEPWQDEPGRAPTRTNE